jgi:hypothetical protein
MPKHPRTENLEASTSTQGQFFPIGGPTTDWKTAVPGRYVPDPNLAQAYTDCPPFTRRTNGNRELSAE